MIKAALREGRKQILRWEENKQLIKGTRLETQQTSSSGFFLCYPPEKSLGNMLQWKNILLTAS